MRILWTQIWRRFFDLYLSVFENIEKNVLDIYYKLYTFKMHRWIQIIDGSGDIQTELNECMMKERFKWYLNQ